MNTHASEAEALARLREERAVLSRRVRRRSEALQYLQLMTKTFVSLKLNDKTEICDTLNALILTFLEARFGAVICRLADGSLKVIGSQGEDAAAVCDVGSASALETLMDERIAQAVDAERAQSLWPGRPAPMRSGFGCSTIETQDSALGLIIVADKSSGEEMLDEDVEFLASAAGLGGMALSNAELLVAQKSLTRDVEIRAEQARRESQEKQLALDELDRKLKVIEEQEAAIRELSTPILQVWDDVLAVPIIGKVDTERSEEIMQRLLTEVTARRAEFVIVDLTGVALVDEATASHLHRLVRATTLLGSSCVLSGIRPAVAQALVSAGVDMSSLATRRNLKEGLSLCIRRKARARAH